MAQLEHDDIQGFIVRGYGRLPEASYLLLHVSDTAGAREWLGEMVELVTPSTTKPPDAAYHVAFTCEGLRALGVHEDDLNTFSLPFFEGMAAPRRTRILGDMHESAPSEWRWGGPDTDAVHVLVLLFGRDEEALETACAKVRNAYRGVTELARLDTYSFEPIREHFSFRDGIAQPIIEGLSRTGPPENTLPPGEFILGYENAYDKLPASPTVAPERDPDVLLPRVDAVTDGGNASVVGDFGRNGSYLVFRQMSQDVKGFWDFISSIAEDMYGSSDSMTRTRIAAKMVGRWPSGAPLVMCPHADDEEHADKDNFGYADDPHGTMCPVGSHIRRTNPRDALEGSAEESITVSNRHRLLRRGRAYGAPISDTIDVDEILGAEEEHEECGLHFICLNADLSRQFEFVQQTWVNNAKFGGLYTDADPLLGNHDASDTTFTMQREPVRERITGMKRFVEVRGGAYFFLPGLRALRYLATL
ncbi:MAG: hypothetical protein WD423_10035 [Rhodothermales bacterium]